MLFPCGIIRYGIWSGIRAPHDNTQSSSISGESLLAVAIGDSCFEIHCHGGRAAVTAILRDLSACGAEIVDWKEWIEVAGPTPSNSELWEIVARTKTVTTTAIALDQARGALSLWATSTLSMMRAAQSTGNIPTSVGSIHSVSRSQTPSAIEVLSTVQESARHLLTRQAIGQHLVDPWRVVIAGPPNVGKSSLINRLLGYRRTITFDEAGTTRDVVTASSALDGWPVLLSDTAGIRQTSDPLESEGVLRATEAIKSADLIVGVFDIRQGIESLNNCLPENLNAPLLLVGNKVDLVTSREIPQVNGKAILQISASNGQGIPELIQAIVRCWVPEDLPIGAPVPITEKQRNELKNLCDAESLDKAKQILSEIALPTSQDAEPRPIIHNIP